MKCRARDLLRTLGISIPDVSVQVRMLSGGQRQAVAVIRSLLGDPKVVLLDEPTAALGLAQRAQVLGLIKQLKQRNYGVVVVSHNLLDVFDVADRISVLRMGENAGSYAAGETTQEEIVAAITGLADSKDWESSRSRAAGVARARDTEGHSRTQDKQRQRER
jgi:D-xylose transport system ATP-binding protein